MNFFIFNSGAPGKGLRFREDGTAVQPRPCQVPENSTTSKCAMQRQSVMEKESFSRGRNLGKIDLKACIECGGFRGQK